jgi:CheY-like chemotaxis protein
LAETGFDLIALLKSLRAMFSTQVSAKGLWLKLNIAPEVCKFIIADEQKLRQILLNLLSNAIKFTEQGGINLNVAVQNVVNSGDSPALQILKFTIIDTGVGIAIDEQKVIFDAFVQSQSGKKSSGGTGLGLTISRKLLKLMGGEIFMQSTLGKGSEFAFTLPVHVTNEINTTSFQQDLPVIGLVPGQPHYRILVADDLQDNRVLLVRFLTQLGLESREAENGEEAVRLYAEWHPNLIWMDISMPILDGYQATRQIRAMEQQGQPSIIIALTAKTSKIDHHLAIAAGCNDYISKPFHEEILLLKMQEHLGLEYLYAKADSEHNPENITQPQENQESTQHTLDYFQEVIASLPASWLEDMENACVCGDDYHIIELAQQISSSQPQLTIYLTDLANRYQFELILNLLQNISSPS